MEVPQIARLQKLLRDETRSLLQYVSESYPWSRADDQGAFKAVCAMARAESDAVTRIGRWLAKQRAPLTFPGSYPMNFTTTNFAALHYLIPRLTLDETKRVANVSAAVASLPPGDGRTLVQSLLDLMKSHVEQLATLQPQATPPALAS